MVDKPADHPHELETLAKVARSLTLSADPQSLAVEILQWTQTFIPDSVGRLWALSDDGQTRTLVASIGLKATRDEPALRPSEGLGGTSVARKETVVSLDVISDPRFLKKDWARSEGLVSSIMLPLTHQDRVYGNLSVFTRTRHPFSDGEVRLLEAFAAQCAAAFTRAALYRESVRKTERLESLNRVSASLASTLGGEDTLQLIVEEAPKLLRLDGARLRLLDGEQLVMAREHKVSGRLVLKEHLRIDESLSGRVAREMRAIAVENIELDPYITSEQKAAVMSEGGRCWIGVPVVYRDTLLGVLVALGKQRRTFTDDDIDLLSSFADHAAIAIENNRLYGALQQELAERRKVEEALRDHQDKLEDLVERRTASLREAQHKLMLKERLAALGQLTASVSHELRTPLGTIRTSLHTLEKMIEKGAVPPQRVLDRATRNIARCDGIISDLLDYTGSPKLKRAPVSLGPWLETVLDEHRMPDGISLHRELDDGIGVKIDEDRFRRVIVNLLQNATQAMAGSERHDEAQAPGLHVRCRGASEHAIIEVEDNGPGIAQDLLPRIFEPLFSTKGFGMGLGLAIVQQIVTHHDGTIDVDSQVGRGTRVAIRLPQRGH